MNDKVSTHEPINFLDSILTDEEKSCEYGHLCRSFSISRSGRFKSKNKKRDAVDRKLFDATANLTTSNATTKDLTANKDTIAAHQSTSSEKTKYYSSKTPSSWDKDRNKVETYKSFYETNM